jgi:lipoyl-dependent peroxiredoxin
MARKGAVAERVRGSAGRSVELVRALPTDAAIDAEVDLGMTGDAYLLQARLNVSLPGFEREVAQAIVDPGPPDLPRLRGDPGRHRRDD